MVRLFWRGIAPVMLPVKVIYPPGNIQISNSGSIIGELQNPYAPVPDHDRTFAFYPCPPPPQAGSRKSLGLSCGRGGYWGLRFCIGVYKLLGREGCRVAMAPIILYFYVAGPKQRHASQQFLTRVLKRRSTFMEGYRHQRNFAMRALDVFYCMDGWPCCE